MDGCAFAGMSLAQIEADYAAAKITGMGYHFLKEHVANCPRGCQALRPGQLPPMQRYTCQRTGTSRVRSSRDSAPKR